MKVRRRVRTVVFTVVALNVAALVALLAQGCRQEQSTSSQELLATNSASSGQATIGAATNSSAVSTNSAVVASNAVVVRAPETSAPVAPPIHTTQYTIAKGDTFSALAKRFHVSVKAIVEANPGVNPSRLQIGQKIQILTPPTTIPDADTMSAIPVEGPNGGDRYTVKAGDTMTKIANLFGTNAKAVREYNRLADDRLYVGQTIKIPGRPSAPVADQTQVGGTNPPTQAMDPK